MEKIYKLTIRIKNVPESEVQKVMDLLKEYESQIDKMALELQEQED